MVEKLVSKSLRQPATIKSASRVLQVFEYFSKVQRSVSLKEIVRELDYPQSSATVLLKSLLQSGYLNYNRAERTYLPTMKLVSLGRWLDQLLEPALTTLLERIQADTGETVILALQNDLYIQYLEVIDSDHEMRFHVEKGSLIPLTDTSLGWMVLSTKSDAQVESIFRQINSRITSDDSSFDVTDSLKRVTELRRQEYCYIRNLPMRGGGCISMILPFLIAGQSAAIGTGGLVDRLDDNLERIVKIMKHHIGGLGAGFNRESV